MAGVQLDLVAYGLDRADAVIARLAREGDGELMEDISVLVENQTKERIDSEKASPSGQAWPEWSAEYAGSRHGGQSLLVASGNLLGSIASFASSGSAEVGSGLVYAAPHNFGSDEQGIPQREFLGISSENEDEIRDLIVDRFEGLL